MQDANKVPIEPPSRQAGWVQMVLIGRRPKNTLLRILVLVVVCSVVFRFVLLPIRVEGISMEPTYFNHRVNCVNRLAFILHEPQRGDVVSVRFSDPGRFSPPSEMLMKRIIALPGETIAFHNGHAYVNGEMLNEPYVKNSCDWEHDSEVCGPDQYYIVGDNRSMPFEYHTKGRVHRDHIIGKVLL